MTRLRHWKLLMPSLVIGCFLLLALGVMALGISAAPGGALEAPARVADDPASHREIAESPAAKKAPAPPDPPPKPKSPSEALRDQVLGILSGSTAEVVAVSIEVDGLGRVVDHNGSTGVIPASTQKLYTSAATLLTLGPDFRYTTRVLAKGDLRPDGSLGGDLILVAGGDPSLTKADLDALAVRVAQAGIRAVEGSLLVDDTRYDRMRTVAEWEPRYMPEDIGPLSAMVVDSNEWTKHPAFLADPALGNLSLFRASLNSAGVALAGPDALGVAPEGAG
ncbi:MAG: D-alanyl-D-alanine carboxypeptidase, partial [Actinomycetota bacterium]